MKNIAIVIAVLALGVIYLVNRDSMPNDIYFSGTSLTLGETSGWQGIAKTYQYTPTGKSSYTEDCVQVIMVKNTRDNIATESVEKTRGLLSKTYNLNDETDDGLFGKFVPSGATRDYYAYLVEQQTQEATYFVMYIIQSNFDDNAMSLSAAKLQAADITGSLKDVFEQISS